MTRAQSSDLDAPSDDVASDSKKPRNTKRTGELAEAAFLHKAVGLGFRVTKPWGDSERYDFVLDSGRRLWRVQIKCTSTVIAGGYNIQVTHGVYGKSGVAYTNEDIDILAAHISPLDSWYVIPVQALGKRTSFTLRLDGSCKSANLEKYREAWHVFGGDDIRGVEEHEPGDTSLPESFPQFRRPVWKPRFFWR
jgi:PD-(D/E)XK endonuclease